MAKATRIQHRRGTAAEWASVNPVLAAGEPGYETDTGQVKTGDGTTQWSQLPSNVRRTNTWQDVQTTGEVELDVGDGLTSRMPLGDVSEMITVEGARTESAAVADATAKYGGLPARVTAVEQLTVASSPTFHGYAYGDSWTYPNYSATPYPEQLVPLMGLSGMDNRGFSGSRIQNVAVYAQSSEGEQWVAGTHGLVTVGALLNNLAEADDTNNRDTALEDMRAITARISAGTIRENNDPTVFTYKGTVITFTSTSTSGGTAYYSNPTLTDGSFHTVTATVNVPAGVNYIQFIGLAPQAGKGAAFTLNDADGVEVARTSTDAKSRVTPGGIGTGTRSPVVMRVPGTAGGVFTLKMTTPTGFSGQVYGFIDCLITLSEAPPMVVILKPVHVTHPDYQKPALETFLRTIPDTVAAEFSNVIVVDPNTGFNTDTMLGADLLHPNALGQEHMTVAVRDAISATVIRRAALLVVPGLVG